MYSLCVLIKIRFSTTHKDMLLSDGTVIEELNFETWL